MRYQRMPIEAESPEEKGYETIKYNLAESSVRDLRLSDILPPAERVAKLYHNYQTMVGPGHWFEQSNQFFRLGFGYPTTDELRQGLASIRACLV